MHGMIFIFKNVISQWKMTEITCPWLLIFLLPQIIKLNSNSDMQFSLFAMTLLAKSWCHSFVSFLKFIHAYYRCEKLSQTPQAKSHKKRQKSPVPSGLITNQPWAIKNKNRCNGKLGFPEIRNYDPNLPVN